MNEIDRRSLLRRAALGTTMLASPSLAFAAGVGSVTITASARAMARPLDHFWSHCVGAGRAAEGLRADWIDQLERVHQACGFRYLRFHGLFHDDMFVYREENGRPAYNWQYIDALFDRMLAIGVRPFVEFGFMPKALAANDGTTFWWKGNAAPPNDIARWSGLITAAVTHWVARYGLDEVRQWWFEVWNEPNLNGFWHGTRTQYFDLYRATALAVKAVDPQLRVGGPATSNFVGDARFDGDVEDPSAHRTHAVADLNTLPWHGVWIDAFLGFAAANRLPVDFVSAHPYPTDFALDAGTGRGKGRTRSIDATRQDLTWLRRTVAKSAYPTAAIHLTEWSSSPSSRDATHDYLQAAAFILKSNLDSVGLVDSLSYWTFTDIFEEKGGGPTIFHGGFGLVNLQGIVKPSFHAYRMLHRLGDEVIERQDGLIVTRHKADGRVTALAYNYPVEVKSALGFGGVAQAEAMLARGSARRFAIDLVGVGAGVGFFSETLDRDHGNAIGAWQALAAPEPPTREQAKTLRAAALNVLQEHHTTDAQGRLRWAAQLAPWSCVLIDQT